MTTDPVTPGEVVVVLVERALAGAPEGCVLTGDHARTERFGASVAEHQRAVEWALAASPDRPGRQFAV